MLMTNQLIKPTKAGTLTGCTGNKTAGSKHKTIALVASDQIDLRSRTSSNLSCTLKFNSYMLVGKVKPNLWQCHQQALGLVKYNSQTGKAHSI